MSRRTLIAVAVALAAGGCGSAGDDEPIPGALDQPARPAITATATAATHVKGHSARDVASRASPPVRLEIPSIRVDVPLIGLGLDAHRALEVPERFDVAGWWTGGSRPGERGPAVIAGHVDSKTGPAVFYELGRLQRGDAVLVRRRDGSSVRFIVQGRERYPKDHFPTARVYGPTHRPTLRLITCSGQFDHSTGHYLDNTVVYASA
jgi:sortase (surface protein transpeptidase)